VVEVLQQEIDFHTQHTIITNFVGTKIPPHRIADWVVLLNVTIKVGVINFCMYARRGFLYLSTTIVESTKKLLILTPHGVQQFIRNWCQCSTHNYYKD